MTPRPAPPAVAAGGGPRSARSGIAASGGARPTPDLPGDLASALLASGIGERWFAVRALGPGIDSPRAARDFTRQTLGAWDLDKVVDDASVIVSELVTNALRHGLPQGAGAVTRDPVELIFWQCGDLLFCAVIDPGADAPVVPAEPGRYAEAGRGLRVVDALASSWGWGRLDRSRKTVWAALRVPGPDTVL